MAGPTKNHRPRGRTTRCAGAYWAFLPALLPPPIEWSGTLVAAFSSVDLAVGRLEEASIVAPSEQSKRNRVYRARAVLAALEAPIDRDGIAPRSTHEPSHHEG